MFVIEYFFVALILLDLALSASLSVVLIVLGLDFLATGPVFSSLVYSSLLLLAGFDSACRQIEYIAVVIYHFSVVVANLVILARIRSEINPAAFVACATMECAVLAIQLLLCGFMTGERLWGKRRVAGYGVSSGSSVELTAWNPPL